MRRRRLEGGRGPVAAGRGRAVARRDIAPGRAWAGNVIQSHGSLPFDRGNPTGGMLGNQWFGVCPSRAIAPLLPLSVAPSLSYPVA